MTNFKKKDKKSNKQKFIKKFAKKNLGQNFLHSVEIREKILAINSIVGENILEIGSGLGFLTEKILEKKANLTAVELDERSVKILDKKFAKFPNFKLIHGSILEQNLDEIFAKKSYGVLANIPYNITNPILRKILSQTKNKPKFAILMVQKEVAEKICPKNKNGQKKRSILSISVEIFAETEIKFLVSKENFNPVPKVDSAIIYLKIREKSLVNKTTEKDFFTIVNAGFGEKRKKLHNSLQKFFGENPDLLLGKIDGNLRAENLTIQDWITITKNWQKQKKSPLK